MSSSRLPGQAPETSAFIPGHSTSSHPDFAAKLPNSTAYSATERKTWWVNRQSEAQPMWFGQSKMCSKRFTKSLNKSVQVCTSWMPAPRPTLVLVTDQSRSWAWPRLRGADVIAGEKNEPTLQENPGSHRDFHQMVQDRKCMNQTKERQHRQHWDPTDAQRGCTAEPHAVSEWPYYPKEFGLPARDATACCCSSGSMRSDYYVTAQAESGPKRRKRQYRIKIQKFISHQTQKKSINEKHSTGGINRWTKVDPTECWDRS